jgi:Cytochrome C oxidase, cbb3-type, subunit III
LRTTSAASSERTPIAECTVEAPTSCPDPGTSYADVVAIFRSKCASCHYGAAGGPWPLSNYDDVPDWKDTVRDDVLDYSMPPPDSGVTLSNDERRAILSWVRCGALE